MPWFCSWVCLPTTREHPKATVCSSGPLALSRLSRAGITAPRRFSLGAHGFPCGHLRRLALIMRVHCTEAGDPLSQTYAGQQLPWTRPDHGQPCGLKWNFPLAPGDTLGPPKCPPSTPPLIFRYPDGACVGMPMPVPVPPVSVEPPGL